MADQRKKSPAGKVIDSDLERTRLHVHTLSQCRMKGTHQHDFYELVYVRKGNGLHGHNHRKYPIFKGDVFIIPPDDRHTYIEESNLHITNILFYPDIVDPYRDELAATPGFREFFSIEPFFRAETSFRYKLHLTPSQQVDIEQILDEIESEFSRRDAAYGIVCTGLFLKLMSWLSRYFEQKINHDKASMEFKGKTRAVEEAISYIEENFENQIRLDELARSAYISSSRLSHLFKQATGMSPLDYVIRVRVDRACGLLTSTRRNITDIAFDVGFHDSSYFSRAFRKLTGVSPSEFRKTADLSGKRAESL